VAGGFVSIGENRSLFELGRDARELVVELGAQAIDHGDDGDRDTGSDQAIFYGGTPESFFKNATNFDI
jgi:hypothetical protein